MTVPFTPYNPGTIGLTNGTKNIVGVGTNFTAYSPYDEVWADGYVLLLDVITDDTHATAKYNFLGTTATGKAYTWKPTSDLTRSLTLNQTLASYFSSGNLIAEANLVGAADRLSYYTGAGAKALATLTSQARTLLASATPVATSLGYTPVNKAGDTMTAALGINLNAAALPTGLSGTVLQLQQGVDTTNRILIEASGTGTPSVSGRHIGGTAASPAATPNLGLLLQLAGFGYDTALGTSAKAQIFFQASQLWAAGANGTQIVVQTTPNGSTTLTTALTIGNDQSLTVAGNLVIGGNNIQYAGLTSIVANTVDGSDTAAVFLGGGGAAGITRGGYFQANGNEVASGNGDISIVAGNSGVGGHGSIVFYTASGIARLTVDSAGLVTLGAGQLAFPATQNPSAGANVLDDYEDGTWTPTIIGTTVAGAHTYVSQLGDYTKVGRSTLTDWYLALSAKDGAMSGTNVQIAGFPFSGTATTSLRQSGYCADFGSFTSVTYSNVGVQMQGSAAAAYLGGAAVGAGFALVTPAVVGNSSFLGGTLVYKAGA